MGKRQKHSGTNYDIQYVSDNQEGYVHIQCSKGQDVQKFITPYDIREESFDFIMITSSAHCGEILKQLMQEYKIPFKKIRFWEVEKREFAREKADEIQNGYLDEKLKINAILSIWLQFTNSESSKLSIISLFERLDNMSSTHRCNICNQYLDKFLPFNQEIVHKGEFENFINQYNMIGSDIYNFCCPHCGAIDRTRHLDAYFSELDLLKNIDKNSKILHIAPEKHIYDMLKHSKYIAGDLFPDGYGVKNIIKLDITNLPFKNDEFDLIICNHVLEHVEDDIVAMKELCRVLNPSGRAILQTPYARGLDKSYEDYSIRSPLGRHETFGQWDHVRIYGNDLFDRMREAGFIVELIDSKDLFSDEKAKYNGFNNEEELILCRK